MIIIDTPDGHIASFMNHQRAKEVEVLFSDWSGSTKISISSHKLPAVKWQPITSQSDDGLMEIYFKNIDPDPRITCEQAHEWLLKTAEAYGATELHFRRRFEAVPVDHFIEGEPITGDFVSALVSIVKEKK